MDRATDMDAVEPGCPHARAYPFSEARNLDLDPTYAKLRSEEPLAKVQMPYGEWAWLITRQKDARVVLRDTRFSREAAVKGDPPRLRPYKFDEDAALMSMDPPDHSRVRRLVATAFTARHVEEMRPRCREVADALIDAMVAAGPPAEFMEDFAYPIPLTMVCELLGVPTHERDIFREAANATNSISKMGNEARVKARQALESYLAEVIAERRRHPDDGSDLLGKLLKVRADDGDRLSEDELRKLCVGILTGGQETTMSQLGNILWTLQEDRSRWDQLVEDPSRIPNAVEELMRFIALPISAELPRVAVEDVELPSGTVRAGEAVLVSYPAVNRDPEVFDDPDRLVLDRGNAGSQLAFSTGIHNCLGAQLARVELQVALQALVTRLPTLSIVRDTVKWRHGALVRGFDRLDVTW